MPTKLKPEEQMTIEEFLAFTAERPDGERWELIEGVAYMNASPTDVHQMIAANIGRCLQLEQMRTNADWSALLGVGTRVPVSPNSLPQPDVFVKEGALTGLPTTDDALVLFEVLSKSNTRRDQAWRRRVYASIPNCQYYVTVSQTRVTATRYDRDHDWRGTAIAGLASRLQLPALGTDVGIPLAEMYRLTPLAAK
jgi:Uma2 family endonuclease